MSLVPVDDNSPAIAIDQEKVLQALKLNPRDPKTQALLLICDRYQLDPILKHMVLVDGNPYVTRDGLLHVAHRDGRLDGIEVLDEGEDNGYWWAKVAVYRKDMSHPFTYKGRYPKSGSNKKYGREMAIKVAEVMSLRRAFAVTGIAAAEEAWDTVDLTTSAVRAVEQNPIRVLPDSGMVKRSLAKHCLAVAFDGDADAAKKAWSINFADDPERVEVDELREVLDAIFAEAQSDDEFDESGGGGESGESPRVDDEPPVTAAPATAESGGDGGAPPAASLPGEEPAAGECDLADLAALMASTGLAEGKVLTRARRLAKTHGLEQPTAFDGLAPGRLLDLLVEWLGQQPENDPTPDGSDTGSRSDTGSADTPPTEGTRPTSAAGNGDGHEPVAPAASVEQVAAGDTGRPKAPPNQRRYFAVATKAAKTAACDTETLRDRLASIVSGGATTSATGFTDALWCDMADMAQTIIDGPDELYQRATGEWTVGRRPVGRQVPRQRPRSAA